ncbi:hypothetical protein AVEN_27970-1 [Araneus ventricosus]|uniref:Uncharacterized protein n=1 Tax=Araneus ventricosus TaxID=182803 RepID=A0A4Y2BHI1_ARAVE|nr:hypothetical protein AVEN_27970-1 [Araneus ventricosus]
MPDMQDLLFQLRFSCKQLERLSKRAEKDEKLQRNKIKKNSWKKISMASHYRYFENSLRKLHRSHIPSVEYGSYVYGGHSGKFLASQPNGSMSKPDSTEDPPCLWAWSTLNPMWIKHSPAGVEL